MYGTEVAVGTVGNCHVRISKSSTGNLTIEVWEPREDGVWAYLLANPDPIDYHYRMITGKTDDAPTRPQVH